MPGLRSTQSKGFLKTRDKQFKFQRLGMRLDPNEQIQPRPNSHFRTQQTAPCLIHESSVTMGDTHAPKPVSVLFVCFGNICRSTMAEGVFQSLTRASDRPAHPLILNIDSCGTGGYHIGGSPDDRTMATLEKNGITSYRHAARKFSPASDLKNFDYIFAMDEDNLKDLQRWRQREIKKLGSEEGVGKVMLFGDFGGKSRRGRGEEIQDPYYGADKGFSIAYEQSVRFSKAFLEQLEAGELN